MFGAPTAIPDTEFPTLEEIVDGAIDGLYDDATLHEELESCVNDKLSVLNDEDSDENNDPDAAQDACRLDMIADGKDYYTEAKQRIKMAAAGAPLFRAMKLKDPEEWLNEAKQGLGSVGEAWSWERSGAVPYCASDKTCLENTVIRGVVTSPEVIDIPTTLATNVKYAGTEKEIRLKGSVSGEKVFVKDIEVGDGKGDKIEWGPLDKATGVRKTFKYRKYPVNKPMKVWVEGAAPERDPFTGELEDDEDEDPGDDYDE
jgi:hypothetical protein